MKKIILVLSALAVTSLAFSQSDCSSIKQDKPRLACYDKAAKEKPVGVPYTPAASPSPEAAVSTASAASEKPAKPGDKEVFKSQLWHVHQEMDAMTDKKSCVALYKNAWTIQGTINDLFVSLKGRGGVKAYTLRVDDAPADSMQLASSMEKSISAVDLLPSFDRIYNGKRVRLQIATVLDSWLIEDIDLAGFKDTVDYMRSNCGS